MCGRGNAKGVNRRVGGLEEAQADQVRRPGVNRRVGGLEVRTRRPRRQQGVNRRVGGLEEHGVDGRAQAKC